MLIALVVILVINFLGVYGVIGTLLVALLLSRKKVVKESPSDLEIDL